jgi:hypothetical protein
VNAGQLGAGVDAEVLGELLARVVKDAQRLGLPAAAVQRDHEKSPGALAQRVLGHQRGQLGHRRRWLPLRQQQVGPFLRRGGAQLGQPQPLRLGERPRHPGERLAAPQRERLVGDPRRAAQVPGGTQLARPAKALLELVGVEAVRAEPQQVAAAGGDQHPRRLPPRAVRVPAGPVRLEDAAQPGHVGVNAAVDGGRRLVAPDRVDQLAARDDPVRAAREHPEHGELPGLARPDLMTVPPDRDRPEHPHPERHP